MARTCLLRTTVLVPVLLISAVAAAQQGYYYGPDTAADAAPRRDGAKGGSRSSASTLGYVPTSETEPAFWETWWALNREEFLPAGGLRGDRGPYPQPGALLTRDDVKSRILPALRKAAQVRDAETRAAAAVAIGKCGEPEDVAVLRAMLDDRDRGVVEAAVLGLGLLRTPEAEVHLAAFLAEESRPAKARALAAAAIGLGGGEAGRRALFDRIAGDGAAKAASGRETAGLESARALGAALWAGADRAGGDGSKSALAAGLLQKAFAAPPTRDKLFLSVGTAALAKSRDHGSLSHVLAGLAEKRSDHRAASAIAAGRIIKAADGASLKRLIEAQARESDRYARRMMIIALGRIGGADAIAALKALPKTIDRQDRSFQFLALGLAKATEAQAELREAFLKGGDQSLRGAAAIALGLIGDHEFMPSLMKHAATQKDPGLLAHLMWAFAVADERSAAETVEKVHKDTKEENVRSASALVLGVLGYTPAEPALLQQLRDGGSKVSRGAAATALGRLGDVRMIDPLIKAVESERETDLTRAAAVVALGVLGRRDVFPEQARFTIDALQVVRHEALDALRDYL